MLALTIKKMAVLVLGLGLPVLLGGCGARGPAGDAGFVADGYAYVPQERQVLVVDVRKPAAPRQVAAWEVPGPVEHVVVADGIAYVIHRPSAESWDANAGPVDGGVQIVDVDRPRSPRVRGLFHTPAVATDVAVAGRHAGDELLYVSDWAGVRTVALRRGREPREVASSDAGMSALELAGERLIGVRGSCSVRTGACSGALWLADVTDAQAPVALATVASEDVPGYDVAVAGDYAYVGGRGIWVVALAGATPAVVETLPLRLGAHRAFVEATPSHVYLVTHRLQVFEGAGTPELREVAAIDLPEGLWVHDAALQGERLYVAAEQGLFIYDVGDPADPVLAGSLRTGGPLSPSPTPTPADGELGACDRFGDPESRLAAATHWPPDAALGPVPSGEPLQAPAHAVHTLFLDETVADLAVDVGFDTVVQVFPWRDLNPEPGFFAWEASDAMVRVAAARGLNLVVRLDQVPAWARRSPAEAGLPFDLAAYADYVAAVATRYRGRVLGYVIWNEPNLAAEWSRSGERAADHWASAAGRVADPADYVGVLGLAAQRIRSADPAALVITAGLAPTNETSARAMDDRDFLGAMLASGVAACSDVIGVHAYGYGQGPDVVQTVGEGLNLARTAALREIMMAYGVDKPVWITELGYTVEDGNQPAVTPEQQGTYLAGAITHTAAAWPWVEMVTVWNLAYGLAPGDEAGGYSLVAADLTRRPAYRELQAVLRE